MGTEYTAAFPEFSLLKAALGASKIVPGTIHELQSAAENILILRYLCEGKYFPDNGKRLSYNEVPWGNVYYRNFEGRCLKRLAHTFGPDLPGFRRIMEETPGLKATALDKGDAGYRFEFINGLFISLLIWAGDDEFPPSAQILFDDNFVFAFTAEDLAVVGEVTISRLKSLR
jgi:hypothetical protein